MSNSSGKSSSLGRFFTEYAVVIIFLVISLASIKPSGLSLVFIVQEIITRLGRNSFLVLALLASGLGHIFMTYPWLPWSFAWRAVHGLGDGIIKPKEDVGAFRSQRLDSLSGKINRIDPGTGDAVLRAYAASGPRMATDIARDGTVGRQMGGWAQAQARFGTAPVYAYLFIRRQPYAPGIRFDPLQTCQETSERSIGEFSSKLYRRPTANCLDRGSPVKLLGNERLRLAKTKEPLRSWIFENTPLAAGLIGPADHQVRQRRLSDAEPAEPHDDAGQPRLHGRGRRREAVQGETGAEERLARGVRLRRRTGRDQGSLRRAATVLPGHRQGDGPRDAPRLLHEDAAGLHRQRPADQEAPRQRLGHDEAADVHRHAVERHAVEPAADPERADPAASVHESKLAETGGAVVTGRRRPQRVGSAVGVDPHGASAGELDADTSTRVPHRTSGRVAVTTPYFSGAKIKDLVNEALIHAIREGREEVTFADVWHAKALKQFGPPDDQEYVVRERWAVAIHEASHAVAAYLLRTHAAIA